jgi:cell division septum initiation protein DivIVA
MASDNGRSDVSLHVLLARANDAIGAFNDVTDAVNEDARSRDRPAPRLAASAAALAPYLHPRHRDRGVGPASKTETDMSIEDEFAKVVPTRQNNGPTDFVHLAEQVAQGQVKLVEELVAQAQALLEKTRKEADALLATAKSKEREIADMTNRIAALGEQVLEANRAFHAATTQGG